MPTLAAVDIGSNSVRLKIARLKGRRLHAIHEDRAVTRLGDMVFRTGYLSPDSMSDTIKMLRRFHRAIQHYGADQVRVVATSAMRDARNSQAFLEWVRSATGWKVEIISGQEEGRLIHLGLVSNMRLSHSRVLMLDLGGGSCELTLSHNGHIGEGVSLPLGAVRLTNEFLRHDPPRKGEMERLHSFVTRYTGKVAERIRAARVGMAVATSGTAAALAGLSRHLYNSPRGVVTATSGRKIAKLLAKLKVEERRRLPGIGPRRAEIVIAGAVVYAEILERCHLRSFRYSALGLRDGLLAQMAAEYDRETRSGKQLESERWDALTTTVKRYRVEEKHAMRVRDFALKLFDATKNVHRLPPEYREWLGAAALLYEVGDYINRDGRHRHTQYIIAHSEMLGFTVEQRRIVAAIARYMGKSRPAATEPPMKLLSPQDQAEVPKAISLLRLSRALNLGRSGAVTGVKVAVKNANVHLKVLPKRGHGAELELWALEKEQDYFRELFGRTLSAAVA